MSSGKSNVLSRALSGAICLLCLAAGQARADNLIVCLTKISQVQIDENGYVYILSGLGGWPICNVQSNVTVTTNDPSTNTVTPQQCQYLYSGFLSAKATQSNVAFNLDFGSNPPIQCSYGMLGQWVWPNPYPYVVNFQ